MERGGKGAFGFIKQHPWLVGGAVLVVVAILMLRGRGGAQQAAGTDPAAVQLQSQAMQLQAQQNAISAQQSGQALQAQYGLQIAQINAQSQLDLASLQYSYNLQNSADSKAVALAQLAAQQQISEASLATQLEINNNATTVQLTSLTDALKALESNNATSLSIAQLYANEQTNIAVLEAQTAQAQIGASAQVAITQTNANVSIAKTLAQASTTNSIISGISGIIGKII